MAREYFRRAIFHRRHWLGVCGSLRLHLCCVCSDITGNFAILDQQAAMRWVQDNICASSAALRIDRCVCTHLGGRDGFTLMGYFAQMPLVETHHALPFGVNLRAP